MSPNIFHLWARLACSWCDCLTKSISLYFLFFFVMADHIGWRMSHVITLLRSHFCRDHSEEGESECIRWFGQFKKENKIKNNNSAGFSHAVNCSRLKQPNKRENTYSWSPEDEVYWLWWTSAFRPAPVLEVHGGLLKLHSTAFCTSTGA